MRRRAMEERYQWMRDNSVGVRVAEDRKSGGGVGQRESVCSTEIDLEEEGIDECKRAVVDRGLHSSSSSDSDNEKPSLSSAVKSNTYRLFGREQPVHKLLGGGKTADIFLWRNKKITAGVLGVATALWVLFELLEYHLLTLLCHIQIVALAIIFLWSKLSTLINKAPLQIPELQISDGTAIGVASALRIEIKNALEILRDIASGTDVKKFLAVCGCWLVGSFSCGELVQLPDIVLHITRARFDSFAEKAERKIKKQYAVFNAKVLSKIPIGQSKGKLA
ncbi:hypothetical protein LguiB_003724 [Lonicera macranthoides]